VRLCLIRSSRLETVICEQRPVIDSLQETAGCVEASCDIADSKLTFWWRERPARCDCRAGIDPRSQTGRQVALPGRLCPGLHLYQI